MSSKLKMVIPAIFMSLAVGCGDSSNGAATPKIVGEPKNTKFSGPVSDSTGSASGKTVTNDKVAATP